MNKALLIRHTASDQGTIGILTTGVFKCLTLELPWNDNINNYSCIPEGTYTCRYSKSRALKKSTYELLKVKSRGGIRVHSGNWAGDKRKGYRSDVLGCILLGRKIYLNAGSAKQVMIGTSSPTVQQFEALMCHEPFELTIKSVIHHA